MKTSAAIAYHLTELRIAQDPAAARHIMPPLRDSDRAILDIGCGIGQTFIAAGLGSDRLLVGIDVDREPLSWGAREYPHLDFVHGGAERLPFRDASFDLAVCRVSLPYTDLGRSLGEIGRVLKPGGRVWCTLHPLPRAFDELNEAARRLALKEMLYRCYVLANGSCLHLAGWQFRCPLNGRMETFQTERAMRRSLERARFADVRLERGRHFVCTASKPR